VKSPEERTTRRPQYPTAATSTPVKAPEEAIAIEAHRGYEGVHKQQEQEIDTIELITRRRSDREVAIDLKSSFQSKL